jgi:hypothetical protein
VFELSVKSARRPNVVFIGKFGPADAVIVPRQRRLLKVDDPASCKEILEALAAAARKDPDPVGIAVAFENIRGGKRRSI